MKKPPVYSIECCRILWKRMLQVLPKRLKETSEKLGGEVLARRYGKKSGR
jgi:hypothetical protein